MMSECQNCEDCMEDRSRQRDRHVRVISHQRIILRMRVSAEERRSLEVVYGWKSSERYCGSVPVITVKQSVGNLDCIRALIGSQRNE